MSIDKTRKDWNSALWCAGLAELTIHVGWVLGKACTGHVCPSGTSVSSICRACPGSLPLLHLLPRASQGAGTAGFSPATAAVESLWAWCHARIHALQWDCGPSLHPADVLSHEEALCRLWLLVFSSCLGISGTPHTGMLGITVLLRIHRVRCCNGWMCEGNAGRADLPGLVTSDSSCNVSAESPC